MGLLEKKENCHEAKCQLRCCCLFRQADTFLNKFLSKSSNSKHIFHLMNQPPPTIAASLLNTPFLLIPNTPFSRYELQLRDKTQESLLYGVACLFFCFGIRTASRHRRQDNELTLRKPWPVKRASFLILSMKLFSSLTLKRRELPFFYCIIFREEIRNLDPHHP